MPVSLTVTYNNELLYSNITDDSLSDELLPENNLHDGQTLTLDIVLDTDHIDYSALGNIDPGLNILLDNNTMTCKYLTEMEFNIYFTTPGNFHCPISTFEAYLNMLSIYNTFQKV